MSVFLNVAARDVFFMHLLSVSVISVTCRNGFSPKLLPLVQLAAGTGELVRLWGQKVKRSRSQQAEMYRAWCLVSSSDCVAVRTLLDIHS